MFFWKKKNNKIYSSDDLIVVRNFSKKFKKSISVNNISFIVKKGSIHGFIGPNGSGKTTTIKTLIGAYIADSGELFINNFKAGSKNANRLIGYIPERASFPKHLNAIGYLKAMAEMSGLKSKEAKTKAISILKNLNLSVHAKRKPISFSSGMQKKILLAQTLISNPDILILDEPAANLDPDARQALFDEILNLRNQGKTIFISSHILSELERIIDYITFLYYGDILYSGKVSSFIKLTPHLFIKTNNNKKLMALLESKKMKFSGSLKNEILIKNIRIKKSQELLSEIKKLQINVISFRMNDLQYAYSNLMNKKIKGTISKNGNL